MSSRATGWEEALCGLLGIIFAFLLLMGIIGSSMRPAAEPVLLAPPAPTGPIKLAVAPPPQPIKVSTDTLISEPEDLGYGTGLPTPQPLEAEVEALRAQVQHEHRRAEMYGASLHQLLQSAPLTPLD